MAQGGTGPASRCTTQRLFASVGCNRTALSLDWGPQGVAAYGAFFSVALYDVAPADGTPGRLVSLAEGHTGRVNCVRWARATACSPTPAARLLASGSSDGGLMIWALNDASDELVAQANLSGHTSSVTSVEMRQTGSIVTLVSASADNTVRCWRAETGDPRAWECLQTIDMGAHFALSLSLCALPARAGSLLAIGCDDSAVHLFAKPNGSDEFCLATRLVGHEDWVRSLSFSLSMGDSQGQDCFCRLWRIRCSQSDEPLADPFEQALKVAEQRFVVGAGTSTPTTVTVSVDAVLSGHDDKVYAAVWHPPIRDAAGKQTQPAQLLTASMDKAMVLWEPDADSGVWQEAARVGEVGGNTLGFYGGMYSPDGRHVLAHGFQGAFHLWRRASAAPAESPMQWEPRICVGGHFSGVMDMAWDPSGSYLLSVGDDQTSRVFGRWSRKDQTSWHELARPQVHGYDMRCVASLSSLRFASGADEKVIRVFEAPATFTDSINSICGVDLCAAGSEPVQQPIGANVPALGLSNKAVFDLREGAKILAGNDLGNAESSVLPFAPAVLNQPPVEGHLQQNTLWPERQKLYGHGYELLCVAGNHAGTLLASACRATASEHAKIILWDTTTWLEVGALLGHNLSVTQIAFSPDDRYIATGSRDRQVCVFERDPLDETGRTYKLESCLAKAHARIIWSLAWAPDSSSFVTAARDKRVKLWSRGTDGWACAGELPRMDDSVTAVDWAKAGPDGPNLLAIGLDSGAVHIFAQAAGQWAEASTLGPGDRHTATVRRVQWCPRPGLSGPSGATGLLLATAGLDNCVKVFSVVLAAE